jgi:hypothetical protein
VVRTTVFMQFYLLTDRIRLERMTVSQKVETFSSIYATKAIVAAFTSSDNYETFSNIRYWTTTSFRLFATVYSIT